MDADYTMGIVRGSVKSDPFIFVSKLSESQDRLEHQRKSYSKARWKRRNTRYFIRTAKRLRILEVIII